MKKYLELQPIRLEVTDFDRLEKRIKALLRARLYAPILEALGERAPAHALQNSVGAYKDLLDALHFGRVTFYRGQFRGKFNAGVTKDLKALGAKWNRSEGTFDVLLSDIPHELRSAVQVSMERFNHRLELVDKKLAQILPEKIADELKCDDLFDKALYETEKDFQASVRRVALPPVLTPERRKRIADEWQTNMQLDIKDFTEKQVVDLRKNIQAAVLSGKRYKSFISAIEDSYNTTANKAKFLARQETSLLLSKYKQVRYEEAGIEEYIWTCVKGTVAHPVRPYHKKLDGTKQRWDNPPIVDEHGNRKHPGQDYNCRCVARPIVRFKK